MVTIILISIGVLYAAAGIFNAVMDKITFHYTDSIFSTKSSYFWNPIIAAANKWKNGDKSQGEKFPLSSTVLVFLTDGWHLFKWLMFFSVEFAIMLPITLYMSLSWPWSIALVLGGAMALKAIRGGAFTLFFDYLLVKPENRRTYTILEKNGKFYGYYKSVYFPADTSEFLDERLETGKRVRGRIYKLGRPEISVLVVTKIL